MICHVVVWRLRNKPKRSNANPFVDKVQMIVLAIRAAVPGLMRLEVGANCTSTPDAADFFLYSEFESWEALKGYETHPLHRELRDIIGPLSSERRVVNYERAPSTRSA
jgi:quinol monooxygenase YgiN